jgi:hypothetical protein
VGAHPEIRGKEGERGRREGRKKKGGKEGRREKE